jgi:dGTPase
MGNEGIVDGKRYIGIKKYGFFQNDAPMFEYVAEKVGLIRTEASQSDSASVRHWWRRHPLVFLVEAADDICYNVMDLEDAYLSGDVDAHDVKGLLEVLMPKSNKTYHAQDEANTVSRYRALAIGGAISACVEAFKQNYTKIMNGELSVSLIEASHLSQRFQDISDVAKKQIFSARRKTELEVYGRNVVHRSLDGLLPLLEDLRSREWNAGKLDPYHRQVARVLRFPTDGIATSYDAVHSLTDFVSGMTDRYAVKVAQMVSPR